jgi:diguanylate cyclase (GGDEF)-like protein
MLITRSWNKKATLIALRLCVAAATGVLLILYPPAAGLSIWLIAPWTAYFATTFAYLAIPAHWFRRRRFDITFVAVELALLGTMFAAYGSSESWFFYPLFLLTVLLAALARRLAWALGLGFAVAIALALILIDSGTTQIGAIILQVGTLLTTAGIVGYLTEELGHEEVLSSQFESALEVSTLLAEAIEVEGVYERLTEVLGRLFHANRVAVILAKPGQTTGRIVSAIDASEVIEDLEIDLQRYPEIRTAIEEQRTVVIERLEKDPSLERVRRYLPPRAAGATILVTPIRQGNDVHGVVFVRLEQSYRAFSDQEIRFCQLMADIAGKAIQRADHFAEVSEAAHRDPLTGLYNVRAFRRALTEEIMRSQRTGATCSLVMIDIDFMKHINDTYGHPTGDQVLRNVAEVLAEQVREVDTVARYGGEEFAVLLAEASGPRAIVVAERLRQRIEARHHDGVREAVTVSIGLAAYPDDVSSSIDLIRAADQALYASKHQGRNRIMHYNGSNCMNADEDAEAFDRARQPQPHDSTVIRAVREALDGFHDNQQIMRQIGAVASLVTLMRARDPSALEDLNDTTTLAKLFLSHLTVDNRERATIHLACLLRDIGKMAVGGAILHKHDSLTREEYEAIREHAVIGAQIVAPLRGLDAIVPFIRHHHERWDGEGYPDGLTGNAIPYGARVVGLIDALHAMLLTGPGASRSHGVDHAREEIARNGGTQFDPELAERLVFVIDSNRDAIDALSVTFDAQAPGAVVGAISQPGTAKSS